MPLTVRSYDDIYEELYKKNLSSLNKQISTSNKGYKTQKTTVSDAYDAQIRETEDSYEDAYRENAVQKLVNERKVAENMANLGLTDSGLNRTQQTAVQLSYANNKASIDKQKRTAVDALSREVTAALAEIETNRANAEATLRSNYNQSISDTAGEVYNSELEAYNKEQERLAKAAAKAAEEQAKAAAKAAEEQAKASYIIKTNGGLLSRDYTGTLSENGVSFYQNANGEYVYVDNNSGKRTTLPQGVNPYTGTVNDDIDSGVFSNGYQPDNVGGEKLSKVEGAQIYINGNTQGVWRAGKNCYYWDGSANKYVKLTDAERRSLGIYDYIRLPRGYKQLIASGIW